MAKSQFTMGFIVPDDAGQPDIAQTVAAQTVSDAIAMTVNRITPAQREAAAKIARASKVSVGNKDKPVNWDF